MKTESSNHETVQLPVSLSPDGDGAELGTGRAATLTVSCPVTHESVTLQRCSFCERGEGLYINPLDDSLTLHCRVERKKG